jgi:hypothetical protein
MYRKGIADMNRLLVAGLLSLFAAGAMAQSAAGTGTALPEVAWASLLPGRGYAITIESSGGSDDPAYPLYSEAKKLIFAEKWNEARTKLQAIVKQYPKSGYRDDAEYWSAYALKHLDGKKAADAYRKFLKEYPHSSYVDDAVADLNEVTGVRPRIPVAPAAPEQPMVYMTSEGVVMSEGGHPMRIDSRGVVIGEGSDSVVMGKNGVTVHSDGKLYNYAYSVAPKARTVERAIRSTLRRMNRATLARTPMAMAGSQTGSHDPETQIQMEVLYALGETKEDEKSFGTLRDVALNQHHPLELREAALEAMADFKKYDVLSVYVDVAKHDTDIDIQNSAIDYITQHMNDRNKASQTLIDLYRAIPAGRTEERQSLFYAIADLGTDRSVDFLAGIARSGKDYELRKDAIYYLGSIGGERARAALYDILKGTK